MSATPAARIIAGRYQVIRRLGAGAFGEVFEVNDLFMSQVCALKFLRARFRQFRLDRSTSAEATRRRIHPAGEKC